MLHPAQHDSEKRHGHVDDRCKKQAACRNIGFPKSEFRPSISGTGFRFPLACKFALLRCARLRRRCRLRVSLKQSPLSG